MKKLTLLFLTCLIYNVVCSESDTDMYYHDDMQVIETIQYHNYCHVNSMEGIANGFITVCLDEIIDAHPEIKWEWLDSDYNTDEYYLWWIDTFNGKFIPWKDDIFLMRMSTH